MKTVAVLFAAAAIGGAAIYFSDTPEKSWWGYHIGNRQVCYPQYDPITTASALKKEGVEMKESPGVLEVAHLKAGERIDIAWWMNGQIERRSFYKTKEECESDPTKSFGDTVTVLK